MNNVHCTTQELSASYSGSSRFPSARDPGPWMRYLSVVSVLILLLPGCKEQKDMPQPSNPADDFARLHSVLDNLSDAEALDTLILLDLPAEFIDDAVQEEPNGGDRGEIGLNDPCLRVRLVIDGACASRADAAELEAMLRAEAQQRQPVCMVTTSENPADALPFKVVEECNGDNCSDGVCKVPRGRRPVSRIALGGATKSCRYEGTSNVWAGTCK